MNEFFWPMGGQRKYSENTAKNTAKNTHLRRVSNDNQATGGQYSQLESIRNFM